MRLLSFVFTLFLITACDARKHTQEHSFGTGPQEQQEEAQDDSYVFPHRGGAVVIPEGEE